MERSHMRRLLKLRERPCWWLFQVLTMTLITYHWAPEPIENAYHWVGPYAIERAQRCGFSADDAVMWLRPPHELSRQSRGIHEALNVLRQPVSGWRLRSVAGMAGDVASEQSHRPLPRLSRA